MNNNSDSNIHVKSNIIKPKYKRVVTPTILQMEMVECGAASLAMILAYHGKFVPLEIIRQECGVTRDGVKAGNIVKAAEKMGLSTEGYRKEPEDLADIPVPAIIHWNFNHFVVFEGFKGGKAYINDPASGHRTISYEEFDMAFTGVVLIFQKKDTFKREGKQSNMLGALVKRIFPVKKAVAFLILTGFLMVIPGLIIPSFTRIFIDNYLLSGESEILAPLLLCMAVTSVIQICLTALREHFLLRMEAKIAINGAGRFFWHILRLPVLFFQQRSPGDISSRMSCNDSVAEFLSSEFTSNVINVLTLVFYFCVMLNYNITLTLIALVFACVNIVYFVYSSNKVEELNRKISQDAGKLYGTSISGLALIETLKATGAESGFFSKWAGYHSKQLNGEQKMGAMSQLLFAIPNLMSGLSNVLVLCIGGVEILNGNMTVGTLMAFQGLLGSFMAPISGLTNMGMRIKQLKADMIRLDDVHKYTPDYISDPERDVAPDEADESSFDKLSGTIEITDLTFGYNLLAPPLIENFNLKLKPGSRVALVGGSGSGKSTVAKLIAGINHPWSGEILFDGKTRKDLPRNVISNSLAVVDQDISMFTGRIRDNIAMWDKTMQDEDLLNAAKDARIHDDIEKRDGSYEAEVSEGGMNFSGGQRQRLEIARALTINPSILILDEATSALDVQTEQIVSENIRERGCTCIIVAHRLSTIRDCDEIIVMKNGKIVQRGTHDEMKDADGLYTELIKSEV